MVKAAKPMMFLYNETICLSDLEPSNVNLYELTSLETVGTVFAIGTIALIGLMIRMFFMYYIRYEAPKDRPINTLIFYDQVITPFNLSTDDWKCTINFLCPFRPPTL